MIIVALPIDRVSFEGRPAYYRAIRTNIIAWLIENVGDQVPYILGDRRENFDWYVIKHHAEWDIFWTSGRDQVEFAFRHDHHAMLFKLTWGGK